MILLNTPRALKALRPRRLPVAGAALALLLGLSPPVWAQDTDPPVIEVTESGAALADGSLFNRAVTPVIQVTDASPVTVDSTLDGAPYTSGTEVTGEGSHLLVVAATDDADNAAGVSIAFEIDTVAPVFVSVTPEDGTLTADGQVTLSGEVAGAASVTVDGQPATLAGDGWSAGPFALSEGERTFSLVASDAAGNAAVRAHRLVRDATPPALSLSQPAAGAVLKATPVDVVGSVSDPHLASVTVNGTAAPVTGGTFLAQNVPLAEGPTVLGARATDAAGNAATVERTVTLDTQPPAVAVTDPAPGTVTPLATLPVSGTAADPHLARVEVNGVEAALDGAAWTASVPLAEGANDLTVTAVDRLGWSAAAAVSVLRDSTAPEVRITVPGEGSHHSAEGVDVSGTVGDEPGVTVTVNGSAATVSAGTWTLAAVPLVEGENRLIARVTDPLGNQGAHTRLVVRDTVAPELVAADPAHGALAVPPGASFTVRFSEALAAPAAGSWRLELADGTPLAATATLDGEVLTVRPDAPLPSRAEVRLVLTASLADPAANPLADPATLAYTVADVEAPPAPSLAATPPGALCAAAVALAGSAEAGAVVGATGGAAGAETRAADDGSFALSVTLRPETLNRLELTARDRDGNRSAATAVEVVHDCTGPTVTSAALDGGVFTVTFSEVVDAVSLGAAGGVSVHDASGPLAGALAADAGGLGATFIPDVPPTAGPYRLEAGTGVRDLAGNPLAFPYSEVLGAEVAPSFLAGRVLDAATGRPLAGAQVVVLSTDGVAHPEPRPAMTTGADGRFRIPVAAGTHDVEVRGGSHTPVFRLATTQSGLGTDLFDPRATPAATPVTVGADGGAFGDPSRRAAGPALELPAGALGADTAVAVTALDEQALPALLPYGWSPRGAVWVDLEGAALAAAAGLSFPVDAPDGTALVVASLSRATLQWTVTAEVTVFDGAVSVPLPAAASDGAWVAVEADLGPPAPPAPVVGAALGSAAAPVGDEVTAASVTFDPAQVLPSQASRATVTYTLGADAASGLPVRLTIQEELTLLDGTVRRDAPYDTDLTVYRAADGTPRSRFRLRPSAQATALPLDLGAEDVAVHRYTGDTLQGNVLGPAGGTVSNADGDRVDLAAGALPEPTAVLLERWAEADLPLAVPAGFAFLGHLELDLSGRSLALPAALSLSLGTAGSGDGLLFQIVDAGTGPAYRPVAALAATATGWTTAAIDPLDLPWPGVREAGRYLFAQRLAATELAYLRGTVHAVGGGAEPGAWITGAVDGTALDWVQISNESGSEAGRYVLPAPLGAASVVAEDLPSGDLAAGATPLTTADERVDLDLLLQLTGPAVVETTPTDGATGVTPGIEPTVRFSEEVDPATLASGVLLYDGPDLVPVTVEQSGTLVRAVPQATLKPATTYELRVTTAVRDLRGNRLDAAVTVAFTTLEVSDSDTLDPSRIHLYEPDGVGSARVQGRSGAVPGGATVFVENTTSFVATPTVLAHPDGSFELTVQASVDDTLLLHVLESGGNETVFELTPFLTADGRGARVGRDAVTFTTLDDLTIRVEEGTFPAPTVVRADPRPAVSPAPVPADFTVLAAFELDFGGAEAAQPLQITLPTPATYSGATGQDLLLARVWRLFGSDHWMLHDLLRVDPAAGVATTGLADEEQTAGLGTGRILGARALTRVASLGSVFAAPQEPGGGPGTVTAPSTRRERKQYLPGAANPGLYVVMESTAPLDFVAFPLAGRDAFFLQLGIDGLVFLVNDQIRDLLVHDAILVPTRRGETYSVEGRELSTGYKFFEDTLSPPAPEETPVLPPNFFADGKPPFPISGSPLRFYLLEPPLSALPAPDDGLTAEYLATGGGGTLRVSAEPGVAPPSVQVRLFAFDTDLDGNRQNVTATTGADGSFSIEATALDGDLFLLAIGAKVRPRDELRIDFSEALESGFPGIEVRQQQGANLYSDPMEPRLTPVGTRSVRIEPAPAWQAGNTYVVRLTSALLDSQFESWTRYLDPDDPGDHFEIAFEVVGSKVLDTFELAAVRDVARLGSWLFVAAGTDGFAVLDASDPTALSSVVTTGSGETEQPLFFPFPLNDPVTSVAVDPHGRVLVAGGGVEGFGQLKIFDPLALDPAAIAADPGNTAVRYAAFRGSTVVSDGPATGTTLGEGRPRHVAVLSDDQEDSWLIGEDDPPQGVSLSPAEPPVDGDWLVTVSGGGMTTGYPVTLKNLSLGRWSRSDAIADGSWSVSLMVRPGDRVELLRNRQTLAYLATLGAGIQVVDVGAFYGETPEDWTAPSPVSDVLGEYTGFGDPALRLCDEPVSDIASSLLDLATLTGDASHPLTLVGLVGFRGLGLFESDPADVGSISFYGDRCARIGGDAAHVFGLDVAQDYPVDLDGNGVYEPENHRDYVVVTHRTRGILIYDATVRDTVTLAGLIPFPGQAERVRIDRNERKLYVSAAGGGLYIVDFDQRQRVTLTDSDADGIDDRILDVVALPGNTNSPTQVFPELGLAFAGGLERGVTGVAVGGPRLVAVDALGQLVESLSPLGISMSHSAGASASFRVQAVLPGVGTGSVRLDVVSLGPGGEPVAGLGSGTPLDSAPPFSLSGDDGILLHRLADHPWEEGFQIYRSEEVVAVADLRAAREYQRTDGEESICSDCWAGSRGVGADARELLSGHRIAVRFPTQLRTTLEAIYGELAIERAELELPSIPWDVSPATRPVPGRNPSTGQGLAVPGTLLHSGEFTHTATDLVLRGRGVTLELTRTYRNQTVGSGPLGPGWDHDYNKRLRALPDGTVEYFDGRGNRIPFELVTETGVTGYRAPKDRALHLTRAPEGWQLRDTAKNRWHFDTAGRLRSYGPPVKESRDTGPEVHFHHDRRSRLTEVRAANGRRLLLRYDPAGRLAEIEDHLGRQVVYGYDPSGRLTSVTLPPVLTGESTFPGGLTTTYTYATPSVGDLAQHLASRDNLLAIQDPRGETWLEQTFTDADGDGRGEEVTSQTWGGDTLTLSYDFGQALPEPPSAAPAGEVTLVDRRGSTWRFEHDSEGRLTRFTDPQQGETVIGYDDYGVETSRLLPSGLNRTVEPGPADDPLTRGNVRVVRLEAPPDPADPEAPTELVTRYTGYDDRGQVGSEANPLGVETVTLRDSRGLPVRISHGLLGEGLAAKFSDPATHATLVTQMAYDDFGQRTEFTVDGQYTTRFEYHESGPRAGFPRRTVVDPGGLSLTTTYETDLRGNVTLVRDPRGFEHHYVYNELDWLVEERHPVRGAEIMVRYLYDENGNVVEERRSAGEVGSGTTAATRYGYGPLNEVTSVQRQKEPGGSAWLTEQRIYDGNRNLTEVQEPEDRITRYGYDTRDLLASVARVTETGTVEESIGYTVDGQPVNRVDGRGGSWMTERDGFGRVTGRRDPLGNRVDYTLDAVGNVEAVRHLDAAGVLLVRTTATHDTLNRPLRETAWLWPPADATGDGTVPASARALTTQRTYDPASKLAAVRDPRGFETTFGYDSAGRRTRITGPLGNEVLLTLDAAGNPRVGTAVERMPDGSGHQVVTTTEFDALGRPIQVTDALGRVTKLDFDAQGNLIREIDPAGRLTVHDYNALGRRTSTVRPSGIAEILVYDDALRLTAYRDALGNETVYTYDRLDNRVSVTYPDGESEHYQYDANGNTTRITLPDGTVIADTYDSADRRIQRQVVPGTEVTSVDATQTFAYDGLDRLTSATVGAITTTRTYDSMSRLLRESTANRTVDFGYDDAGHPTHLTYPSGRVVELTPDALGRTAAIGWSQGGGVPERKATYGYRGTGLIASKALGADTNPALHTELVYDDARRPTFADTINQAGTAVLTESLAWTPRGLLDHRTRQDLFRTRLAYAYDPGGRLTSAERQARGTAGRAFEPASVLDLPQRHDYTYDAAQNLLGRGFDQACADTTLALPLDGTGRNRPGMAGTVPLAWDRQGNLSAKGDQTYRYDERSRLVEVRDGGVLTASYDHDAFGRRVRRQVGATVTETVWVGWQPVETYVDGVLVSRRTYGLGLDEVVRVEKDLDGDGILEQEYLPVYDRSGNLVAMTGADGAVIERYEYTPYGERRVFVDLTPPAVTQVRVVGAELWLELSEEVQPDRLEAAQADGHLLLVEVATGATWAVELDLPVVNGPVARRRWVLRDPGDPDNPPWPTAGTEVRLELHPGALRDAFGNQPADPYLLTFPWPAGDSVLSDATAPQVQSLCVLADGRLELAFSEPAGPAGVGLQVTLDGAAVPWTAGADGYTLTTADPVSAGPHTLQVGTGPLDLAGLGLAQSFAEAFTVPASGSVRQAVHRAPHPSEVATSTIGNLFGFHGLHADPETGFSYARRRHYDPHLGRFVQPDPLGYADAPSLYQYALNNPVNFSDPTGEYVESAWDVASLALGIASLTYNVSQGHWGWAALDVVGIVVDSVAVATPLVPGGAGALLSSRHAVKGLEAAQLVDRTLTVGQAAYEARSAYQEGHYGASAFYAGMAAFGVGGVTRSPYRVRVEGMGGNLGNTRIVYDPRVSRYRDPDTGRFVSQAAVPRGTTRFVADAEVTSFGRVVGRGTVDVRATVEGIESGALKPRAIFQNRPLPGKTTPELPVRPPGYYQEFVHPTPGVRGVGPQRIVRGQGGELYYTPDHYTTFIPLN